MEKMKVERSLMTNGNFMHNTFLIARTSSNLNLLHL